MAICCVEGCKTVMQPDSDKRFFKLPWANEPLLKAWLNGIHYDRTLQLTEDSVICSSHFKYKDYCLENGIYEISPTAVPSKKLFINKNIEKLKRSLRSENDDIEEPCNINNEEEYHNRSENEINVFYAIDSSSKEKFSQNYSLNNNIGEQNTLPNVNHSTEDNSANNYSGFFAYHPDLNSVDNTQRHTFDKSFCNQTMSSVDQNNPSIRVNNKAEYRLKLPEKFLKKLRLLSRTNNRLISKIKKTESTKLKLLNIQMKYLILKKRVLETEEKLINLGIDTSRYSAFQSIDFVEESDDNGESDFLDKCALKEIS